MNASNIKIINTPEFDTEFDNLINNNISFFGYFHGTYGTDGISWCGDCNDTKPMIDELKDKFESQDKILLCKFPVERTEWKNLDTFYRNHKKLKLTNLPTLIYYYEGSEMGRLIEGEILNRDNLNEFINQAFE